MNSCLLSCAAALAVLEVLEQENLLQRANEIRHQLQQGLRIIATRDPETGHVRGLGAMVALALFESGHVKKTDVKLTAEIVHRARDHELILLSCGASYHVLRIMVPLTVTDEQINQGPQIITQYSSYYSYI